MANLPTRTTASFFAIQPIPSATPLDDEFNQLVGGAGILNGGTTGKKLLIKSSDAADPPVDCDQIGAGLLARWKQNGSSKVAISNAGQLSMGIPTGTSPLSVASTTVNTNLNADMVDGFHGADLAQLATHRTYFSTPIGFETDPTITTTNIEDRQVWIAPDNIVEMKIGRLWILFNAGSHTAGGSLVYTIRKRNFLGGAQSDLGSVSLDNTNNTIRNVYYNNIADFTLTAGDIITFYKDPATTGTNSERSVTIGFVGYQRLST
jgi:hypothetical protein